MNQWKFYNALTWLRLISVLKFQNAQDKQVASKDRSHSDGNRHFFVSLPLPICNWGQYPFMMAMAMER